MSDSNNSSEGDLAECVKDVTKDETSEPLATAADITSASTSSTNIPITGQTTTENFSLTEPTNFRKKARKGMANSQKWLRNSNKLKDFAVKLTVLPSRMNTANFENVHLVSWDQDATPNAANELAPVIFFLMRIARKCFLIFGPQWTGTRERFTLSAWRTWLTWNERWAIPSEDNVQWNITWRTAMPNCKSAKICF